MLSIFTYIGTCDVTEVEKSVKEGFNELYFEGP